MNHTPRHSSFDVGLYSGAAAVGTRQSVVGYDAEKGVARWRRTWPRDEIDALETSEEWLFVAVNNQYGVRNIPPGKKQPRSNARLMIIGRDRESSLKHPIHAIPALRWCSNTNLLYESTQQGIGIVDATAGKRVAAIVDIEPDVIPGRYIDHTTLPLAVEDHLYFLTSHHTLACIKNPALSNGK